MASAKRRSKSSSKSSKKAASSKSRGGAKRSSSKKSASKKRSSSARELIEPHAGDKRYVRRAAGGQFKESDNVSRSLSADARRKSKTASKSGQGDRGDRKR